MGNNQKNEETTYTIKQKALQFFIWQKLNVCNTCGAPNLTVKMLEQHLEHG